MSLERALGEPLRLPPRPAHLHIRNLPVADRQDLMALSAIPVSVEPRRGTDDLVAELNELRAHLKVPHAAIVDLLLQDRTGLIRAPS
jgi:hypothetical protein